LFKDSNGKSGSFVGIIVTFFLPFPVLGPGALADSPIAFGLGIMDLGPGALADSPILSPTDIAFE
jgi:hypothetical protein